MKAFSGTDRFTVESEIGEGAFGMVYKAYDNDLGIHVALKVLHGADAQTIATLKREFRSLTGVVHPNLVKLYELVRDGETWFFTMELVRGTDFFHALRPGLERMLAEKPELQLAPISGDFDAFPALARLQDAARQLVQGIDALHQAGKLHRDLKPSNVLLTDDGRVLILDFGLAAERTAAAVNTSETIEGTPEYMSPEQAMGQPLSPESDWYGLGTILYEVLTGHLPFTGDILSILQAKVSDQPPAAQTVAPWVPVTLDRLCTDLLRTNADDRPSGREIRRRLGVTRDSQNLMIRIDPAQDGEQLIIGRERELTALWQAFEYTLRSKAAIVRVTGVSGMGKSALASAFLNSAASERENLLVLRGRCAQQESVPYKAFDRLIDQLCTWLDQLEPALSATLLPQHLHELCTLFPLLRQVRVITQHVQNDPAPTRDPVEQRQLGFSAFVDLMRRVARHVPTVVFIDDVQWGDEDSAALMRDLVRPPAAPPLLLIVAHRPDDQSPLVDAVPQESSLRRRVTTIVLDKLVAGDAGDLCMKLLGAGDHAQVRNAEAIVREAAGNPMLITELAQHLRESGASAALGSNISLEELLRQRLTGLDSESRRLLEVLAVAGHAMTLGQAKAAAGFTRGGAKTLLILRNSRLVRSEGMRSRDEIQMYHERIQRAVLAQLTEPRIRALHQRVAEALEASPNPDPENLAFHFLRSGDSQRALQYVEESAVGATNKLAFNRAVELYRAALDLGGNPGATKRWQTRLAENLVKAGRGAEAAQAYLAAAAKSTGAMRFERTRLAAEQFLKSGHVERGIDTLQRIMQAYDMTLAESPIQAWKSLSWSRIKARFRRLRVNPPSQKADDPEVVTRLDACWAISVGLMLVDPLKGAEFHTRQLADAVRHGDPRRAWRAIGLEAIYFALVGEGQVPPRATKLCSRLMQGAEKLSDPYLNGFALLVEGIISLISGRFAHASAALSDSEQLFSERCVGAAWEMDISRLFLAFSRQWAGNWGLLADTLPVIIADAETRGDTFAATNLVCSVNHLPLLCQHQAGRASRDIDRALNDWSGGREQLQYTLALASQVDVDLYQSQAERAWKRLETFWPRIERNLVKKLPFFHQRLLELRLRCALAMLALHARSADPFNPRSKETLQHWQKLAQDAMGTADRSCHAWWRPILELHAAGLAYLRKESEAAQRHLAVAESGLGSAQLQMHLAVARYCRGVIVGEKRGQALRERSVAFLSEEQVTEPRAMIGLFAPWI